MKGKKMLAKCSVLLSLLLLCSTSLVQAAEYKSEDNVQQKVLDIIEGSDEIYGTGAPIAHNIKTTTSSKEYASQTFISGGVDHTHQYILASALVILNNDIGNCVFNTDTYTDLLMSNTDWPDVLGNETDFGTYAGHFYDPDTEKNWLGLSSPTCKTRANSYFNKAVSAYQSGDIESAMKYLGRGTHYMSDANEPHHASNLIALNSNHTEFEEYVDKTRTAYKVENNTLPESVYNEACNTSVNNLVKETAVKAKALVPLATVAATYDEASQACVTNAISSVTQYIYKFGKAVGIY